MIDSLTEIIRENRDVIYPLLRRFIGMDRPLLLRSDLWDEFRSFCETEEGRRLCGTAVESMIAASQEAAIDPPWICLAVRPRIARWTYLKFHCERVEHEEIPVGEFLAFKERIVNGRRDAESWTLEVDLGPFNREFPRLKESRSIGRGVEFLNRQLSSKLFRDLDDGGGGKLLLDFLKVHQTGGIQLMVNERIGDVSDLRSAARRADEYLSGQPAEAEWGDVGHAMHWMGFEPGWGRTTERMRDTLHLLSDILEAPSPDSLQTFLGRIPMIFSLLVLSPHGYFGQSDVLGLPDTGGQVVYILDQVRALEREMRRRIDEQGLDIDPRILIVTRLIPEAGSTTCDQRIERVVGTENVRILRVPMREDDGRIVPHWISRFEIWPYLERFADDVEREVRAELDGKPDLIVGNYSDGNLVATLLSNRLHVTQCNIAHALEKTKYLHADLYWKSVEDQYHFSAQFTADLVSMNAADFIITSTYQEIAGTDKSIGQYESYGAFTMPGMYRVVNGVDLFDPKFNIVSPGADASVYFGWDQESRRLTGLRDEIEEMIRGGERPDARGRLEEPDKPILFTMARLDYIKNITGLVDWYGRSERLREMANLLVIAGHVDVEKSADREEQEQIRRMHEIFEAHGLDGQVRWLGTHLEKNLAGEVYRVVADGRGAFVQPALFEAFGLTVIEAMSSGLPTFATCFGGPLEIIEHGTSGFHIDPNHGEESANRIADFFERCRDEAGYWESISRGALDRVKAKYTWDLYAERMMTLSRIYGFWKYVSNLEREETKRYLEMFYGLQYRPIAARLGRG